VAGDPAWAIHPIHVESVAWLSERKGVLAGLFAIACGQAWIRYRRGGGWGWLVAGAAAAVAATWSKAPAMFAPAVFAAWTCWSCRRRGGAGSRSPRSGARPRSRRSRS